MTLDVQTKKYTVEEFLALSEDDNEYELVNGKLIEGKKEGPSKEHGRVVVKLSFQFEGFLLNNPIGEVFAGSACRMNKSYAKPDVTFLLKERIPAEIGVDLPYPDLAVEVMSQSHKFFEVREKVQVVSTDDELDTAPVINGFKLAVNKLFA
jgi:Uma2 family endonuclease